MRTPQFMLILTVIFSVFVHVYYCRFARKHRLELLSATACPDNDQLETPVRNLKLYKINSTFAVLSYDIHYKRPLDEKIGLQIIMEKWSDQGWVALPLYPFNKDICNYCLHSPVMHNLWVNWAQQMGVPEPEKCPIPARKYSMKNGTIDVSLLQNVPFWTGKYRIFIIEKIIENMKTIYCFQVDFESKEVL